MKLFKGIGRGIGAGLIASLVFCVIAIFAPAVEFACAFLRCFCGGASYNDSCNAIDKFFSCAGLERAFNNWYIFLYIIGACVVIGIIWGIAATVNDARAKAIAEAARRDKEQTDRFTANQQKLEEDLTALVRKSVSDHGALHEEFSEIQYSYTERKDKNDPVIKACEQSRASADITHTNIITK